MTTMALPFLLGLWKDGVLMSCKKVGHLIAQCDQPEWHMVKKKKIWNSPKPGQNLRYDGRQWYSQSTVS
jgi:hypothetical protein